jgi:hypothetical protein
MTIDLMRTPDYALAWLLEWTAEEASREKAELDKLRAHS